MSIESIEQERSHEIEKSTELVTAKILAKAAGEILKKYHRTSLDVDYKKDEFDPVSIADRESDALLREDIAKIFPDDEILSEENPLLPSSYEGRVWMIDPLDDTKGYLAGRDTSSIMIGLLDKGRPVLGVVYLPFRDEWYYGEAGKGSYRVKDGETTRLQVPRTTQIEDAVLVGRNASAAGDVRPIEEAVAQLGFKSTVAEGSIGAKIGLIAAGEADAHVTIVEDGIVLAIGLLDLIERLGDQEGLETIARHERQSGLEEIEPAKRREFVEHQ